MSLFGKFFNHKHVIDGTHSHSVETSHAAVVQLDVDVFQTDDSIFIYALVPGSASEDVNISIEGNADIVRIEGTRRRPRPGGRGGKGYLTTEECVWGEFYRRIVLPMPVDIREADASVENGVLILKLPFAN